MDTKLFMFKICRILLSVFLLVFCGCQNGRIQRMSFDENGLKVVYKGKSQNGNLDYLIICNEIVLHSERIHLWDNEEKNLDLLKKQEVSENVDTIAYTIAQTGVMNIHYILKDKDNILADSIKKYYIPYDLTNISNSKYAKILTDGFGVIKEGDYLQYFKQAKSFLVRNKIQTTDEFIGRMAYYIYVLLNNGHEKLYELSEVKTAKKMPKKSVIIETNMDFDYFYLLAVNNEKDLKTFAESEIVDGFKQGKESQIVGNKRLILSPKMHETYGMGRMYLFLLGINKNWDYDYIPVGGIIIDNIGPILSWEDPIFKGISKIFHGYSTDGYLDKFKNYYIRFPLALYQSEIKSVTWGNFEGNNYWGYPIVFTVNIAEVGDLAAVILQGKRYEIDLLEAFRKKHFIFEHRVPQLNIGDNFITIKFVDRIGNVSSGKINIATKRVGSDEN